MAAKTIQVSDDNGSTWFTLPGSTGEYSENTDSITDTIFGQTFESAETGLISWTISANALFKGFAGYKAKIKTSGTPTALTDAATTNTSGKTYQITDATRRILDRSTAVTVEAGGSPVAASNIESIDYLFGSVTFISSYTPAGAVTISGMYLPTADIGTVQSFTLTQSTATIDNTDFATAQSNGGFRVFVPGLRTVSMDLTGFYDLSNGFSAALLARNEVIIEINPDGSGLSVARGFFKPGTHTQSGDVGALEQETITYTLNVPSNDLLQYAFTWNHDDTSTIPDALKIILTSWLAQSTIDVQYLWNGTAGQSGDAIVTDVSLESSLDGMNTFTANFQGTGAPVTV